VEYVKILKILIWYYVKNKNVNIIYVKIVINKIMINVYFVEIWVKKFIKYNIKCDI
jgi:hypothetical protein